MKAIYRMLICAALVAAPVLFAQTYQSTATPAAPFQCSPSGVYCYGAPFYLNGNITQPVSTPWIDVTNPVSGYAFIAFAADYDEGPLAQYGTQYADAGTMTVTYSSFTSAGHTGMLISAVSFSFGNHLGVFAGTLNHYWKTGTRYGGWSNLLTGGTIVINQPSGPVTDSPIAPTPVCLPGPGCPPHDWRD